MYLDGPWATTTYKDAGFTGYGTSLIPAGPGGSVSVVGGEDLVIAKGGKHLADTIKFVQFLQSPFAQLRWQARGHGGLQDGQQRRRQLEPGPSHLRQGAADGGGSARDGGLRPARHRLFQPAGAYVGREGLRHPRVEHCSPRSQQGALRSELVEHRSKPRQHPTTLSSGAATPRPPRPHRVRRIATPYLLLTPALVMYAVFTVYPISASSTSAFSTGTSSPV